MMTMKSMRMSEWFMMENIGMSLAISLMDHTPLGVRFGDQVHIRLDGSTAFGANASSCRRHLLCAFKFNGLRAFNGQWFVSKWVVTATTMIDRS